MKRETNIFDKIGTLIPGYKGYQERDSRRECDRQLKEQIASKLSETETTLNSLNESSELSNLSEIEKIRKKINNLKDLIKYAPYGASSFFSDFSIKNDELENIYQMDMDILDDTENLQKTTLLNDLQKIKTHTQSLEIAINKRNQYLKDL
jgi:hypothetical protein